MFIKIEFDDNNKIVDLKAWIIKYFIANSLLNLLKKIRKGIKDIKLNSKDIQIENHELHDREKIGDRKIDGII